MTIQRTILGLGRHGVTPVDTYGNSLDSLTDQSVCALYQKGVDFASALDADLHADRSLVLHSNKQRTLHTAQAQLAGMRSMTPQPLTEADLQQFHFDGALFVPDLRLSYADLRFNLEALGQMGDAPYLAWMMTHRHAIEMRGLPITSFQDIYTTRKGVLTDALRQMTAEQRSFGFICTHSPLVDALAMAAVDSARERPLVSYDEIGGPFGKEDVAYLFVDVHDKSGSTESRFVRGSLTLPVDFAKLIN